jgi:hypothetical protein
MTAPAKPPTGSRGIRRRRAWFARRVAAVASVVAMLGLGGLMYWNDQQGTAGAAQGAAQRPATAGTSQSTSRSDDGGSGDDITELLPGLSSGSSSSSSSGASQQQTAPTAHTNTRGS